MDHKLKQRLTGAIVLVALAVIFVPIILEGPDDDWTPRSHSIPVQPQMDYRASMELDIPAPAQTVEEPTEVVITETLDLQQTPPVKTQPSPDTQQPVPAAGKASSPATAPEKPAKTTAAPARIAKVAEPQIKGWFVQVGSFGQEINAKGLQERLQSAGYETRLQKAAIGKGYAYRVLVGPSSSRTQAEKVADRLKSGQQLAGMVIEY
jgi:DedD protein